jgi:3-isopropylmalate/(R)-2-methylmalate dehydratase small subunit
MIKFTSLISRVVVLNINNVDTDQIIPARFLKATDKVGMGDHLFADWRYNADGSPNLDFVLNKPESQNRGILLTGDNFGCGSSREHALWALTGYGFRAVVSTSFADIFRGNALKNGLLPVQIDQDAHLAMLELLRRHPDAEFSINLQHQTLVWPESHEVHFPIDEFSKNCLLEGVDELGYLFGFEKQIVEFEAARN